MSMPTAVMASQKGSEKGSEKGSPSQTLAVFSRALRRCQNWVRAGSSSSLVPGTHNVGQDVHAADAQVHHEPAAYAQAVRESSCSPNYTLSSL